MKEHIRMYHDPELGPVPVRYQPPLWPWILAAVIIGSLSGVVLAWAIVTHANNAPTGTPIVEAVAP